MCGTSEFQLTETPQVFHYCHCSRCRRATAAAHATDGQISMNAVRFIRGEDHLKDYKLPGTSHFAQVFCDLCGSKMPRLDPEGGTAMIPLGSLDDDPKVKAGAHLFAGSKAEWFDITGELPVFEAAAPA